MLQLVFDALVLGSIYLLFSIGLSLSWGVLNILNLAHGSLFMFGAFSAYLVVREVSDNIPLAVLVIVGALVSGLLALLLQVLVYRPLQRRAIDDHSASLGVLIASIGASLIPVAVALNVAEEEVVNLPASIARTELHVWGPVSLTTLQIVIVIASLLVTTVLSVWVARTRSGRALRTISADPEIASLMGIPVARLSAVTMFLSGALAGVAGLLLGANANAIEPHMGEGLLLKAFAVVVLGGVGSIPGAAIGAFVLAFAESAAVRYIGGDARDYIAFLLIIVVLLARPQGIFPRPEGQRA